MWTIEKGIAALILIIAVFSVLALMGWWNDRFGPKNPYSD